MFIIDMKIFILLIAMHNCYFAFDYLPVAHWQIYCILKTKSLFFLLTVCMNMCVSIYVRELVERFFIATFMWCVHMGNFNQYYIFTVIPSTPIYVNDYVFTVIQSTPILC